VNARTCANAFTRWTDADGGVHHLQWHITDDEIELLSDVDIGGDYDDQAQAAIDEHAAALGDD
jgi:hypothetical protein